MFPVTSPSLRRHHAVTSPSLCLHSDFLCFPSRGGGHLLDHAGCAYVAHSAKKATKYLPHPTAANAPLNDSTFCTYDICNAWSASRGPPKCCILPCVPMNMDACDAGKMDLHSFFFRATHVSQCTKSPSSNACLQCPMKMHTSLLMLSPACAAICLRNADIIGARTSRPPNFDGNAWNITPSLRALRSNVSVHLTSQAYQCTKLQCSPARCNCKCPRSMHGSC